MVNDRPRRLFVAGATGATGTVLVRLAQAGGAPVVPQVRPQSASRAPPNAAIVDLADQAALVRALSDCTTVVQLVGTMRSRFADGDTYETSDIGTTRALVAAGQEAGVDHVVLLSSTGAGRPRGAYLQAKAQAESIVRESGLEWTIFRPSFLLGDHRGPPRPVAAVLRAISPASLKPIRLEDLARAILHVGLTRAALGQVLEGRSLFAEAQHASALA